MAVEVLHEPTMHQPFDLELTLQCGQGYRWREVHEYLRWASSEDDHLRRSSDGEGLPGWFSTKEECLAWSSKESEHRGWYSSIIDGAPVWIRQMGGPGKQVEFETTANASEMANKLRSQFRLDDDIEDIYNNLCNGNETLAQLVINYSGLRLMRVEPWECLVFFILAAGSTNEKAQQRMDRIARELGTGSPLENGRHPFPSPESIGSASGLAKLNEMDLASVDKPSWLFEAGRAAQGLGVWQPRVRGGGMTLNNLATRPWARGDAIVWLRKIPGLGAWAANCVALFGLGHLDAFPVDARVIGALKSLYLSHPYAGYVSQFLVTEGREHRVVDNSGGR